MSAGLDIWQNKFVLDQFYYTEERVYTEPHLTLQAQERWDAGFAPAKLSATLSRRDGLI
ncbi:MAG TPA: hypothetical protein P5280_09245 [Cyclobacteriaceae bacterium]|nr:hypothetical protein [Cyclobacteriaceae bacterium]